MKIGIVGSGNMGRTLGVRWSRAGHDVVFGSRELAKAKSAAAGGSPSARAGDFDIAASFGDVVLYTVRGIPPSRLLRDSGVLAGKIVVDCTNTDFEAERGDFEPAPTPSLAEQLAADVPAARVVKAFNTLPHRVLELPRDLLAPRRISVFLCADDPVAKDVVKGLAEELGLVGIDCGTLERSGIIDGVVDFIRFQIAAMGLGPFATVSLDIVPHAEAAS